MLGDATRPPKIEEVMELLDRPERNAVVNLLGIPLQDRPAFFEQFNLRLRELP